MMPKLIALARRRTSAGMSLTGTPNISDAVMAWMSRPSRNALRNGSIVGDLGEQPQLDLRVIGGHQLVAGIGDEGAADFAAVLGADRNVLQVRIGRRQPAGGGGGERVVRMHAMRRRIDEARQRIGIGRFQFRHLAPVEDLLRQFVALLGQFLERRAPVAHWPVLVLVPPGNCSLPNRISPICFGEPRLTGLAGECADLGFKACCFLGEFAGQPRQHLAVDRDAAPLHLRQHAQERPLQRLVDREAHARRQAAA